MQNVYLSMELYVRPGNMCSCVMCFGTIMFNGVTVCSTVSMIRSVWILSSVNSPGFHDNIMINQLFLQTNIGTYTTIPIDGHAFHGTETANV